MFSRGFLIAMVPVAVFGAVVLTRAQREMDRSESTRPMPAAPLPDAPPGVLRINGDGRFGCSDRGYFERLVKMKAQGDEAAVTDGIRMGLASGRCASFEAGQPVFLEQNDWGLIRVRPVGQQTSYWTFTEAAT
jgi:hypothetical protein